MWLTFTHTEEVYLSLSFQLKGVNNTRPKHRKFSLFSNLHINISIARWNQAKSIVFIQTVASYVTVCLYATTINYYMWPICEYMCAWGREREIFKMSKYVLHRHADVFMTYFVRMLSKKSHLPFRVRIASYHNKSSCKHLLLYSIYYLKINQQTHK